MINFTEVSKSYDRSIIIHNNNEIIEMNFCQLQSLHASIYINGINTQALILRHIRDDVLYYNLDNNECLKRVLLNVDLRYCTPFYERLFKKLQNDIIPEHMY